MTERVCSSCEEFRVQVAMSVVSVRASGLRTLAVYDEASVNGGGGGGGPCASVSPRLKPLFFFLNCFFLISFYTCVTF